jgi:hypothetical protein
MTVFKNKTFNELTPDDCNDLKIQFAPGCFDDFDGTQEELDEFIAEITNMIRSGEVLDQSNTVDIDDLIDEDPELAKKLLRSFSDVPQTRNLQ